MKKVTVAVNEPSYYHSVDL